MSQSIRRLEDLTGVRLFDRNSRSVRLTEAGRALLRAVDPALAQLEAGMEEAHQVSGRPSGLLRISLSRLAAEICVIDRMAGFAGAYPLLTLELSTDDRLTDIVARGFDAGIRLRETLENDMVARPIGPPLRRTLFASPAYVERHGLPLHPRDLDRHRVIRYRFPGNERLEPLRFREGDTIALSDPAPALVLDDNRDIARAVREGLGIAQRFRVTEEEAIAKGELVEMLVDTEPEPMQFFIYYPSRQRQPAKLRAFLDWFC